MKSILVTGGAGFIGSHLVDELIRRGNQVRILDNLDPQVHGPEQNKPDYLNKDAEFIRGDILSRDALEQALKGIDIVYHCAAMVGVGQSMYKIYQYTRTNSLGGALLLDVIISKRFPIEKLLVASSMSIYGEGKYVCDSCGPVFPRLRLLDQLQQNDWEMKCPRCGQEVKPLPTDELKPLYPNSVYAITKRDHEEMFLSVGEAYRIPSVALRFFNAYGPRQALSNPYTGVCAIFASRILNSQNPVIFEDGLQTRDFIHVKDIVQGLILCQEKPEADYHCFNLGSGRALSIKQIAELLIKKLGREEHVLPEIVGKFRAGDIRHCFADITRASSVIGFKPSISFEDGLNDLIAWAAHQSPPDTFQQAYEELRHHGLTY
ncbi:NAD-dependent epimerase/dehydratase family protein [bacterium]|nr:NAD-dependent epimerase/dehydratase family protein [bacterium]